MRAACLAAGLMVTAAVDAAASTTLSLSAGIGGLVKAGRWVPVRVTLVHTDGPVDADLVLSFGEASVSRRVELAGQSRREFELYIRASDPAAVITARLQQDGGVMARAEAAVKPLPQAERVALCVEGSGAPPPPDACSATMPSTELPRSLRGYEAVDAVVRPAADSRLTAEQQSALSGWRALQRLNEAGELGLVGQAARPTLPRGLPPSLLRVVALFSSVYVAAIVLVGFGRSTPRRLFRHGYVVLGAITACGSATAFAFGTGAVASPIAVHHQTIAEQLPGSGSTVLTLRGIAEFPAMHDFHLRWPLVDAMVEPSSASGASRHTSDNAGYPVLSGVRGLGTRQAFAAEGIYAGHLLAVETAGRTVRILNRSPIDFEDCRFADGFEPQRVGELRQGGSVTATEMSRPAGPVFTCGYAGMIVPFEEPRFGVVSQGTTVLAVYR